MLLPTFLGFKIVSIFVSFSVSSLFHEFSWRIAEMERDTQIPIFSDISVHCFHGHIDTIIFWRIGEIVGYIEKWELTFWHAHFFTDFIDTIREDNRLRIIDVFTGEIHHTAGNVARIFTTSEHATNPINSRIPIRVTE